MFDDDNETNDINPTPLDWISAYCVVGIIYIIWTAAKAFVMMHLWGITVTEVFTNVSSITYMQSLFLIFIADILSGRFLWIDSKK